MLTELYIEPLLVDEKLADQVWELWDQGLISDKLAAWAWSLIRHQTDEHHIPVLKPKAPR